MMRYHSIQVSRPFDVVKQQLAELDERWLEDTVRAASERSEASPRDTGAPRDTDAAVRVRVRVGRPYVGRRVFALPMEWEVQGGVLPSALTGELEVLQVGPAEAQVGVRMVPRPELLPKGDEERTRIQHTWRLSPGLS